ncbi:hypothetical protein [Phaffia rhodozyma]|uniref:Uncharacterized protein n=1 Tax=Phaffia rhodozyma TaxID=264483 RepID=A0A0F7SSH9_PHARH|nr:hypothetical protein [Phaffia rhodozyma]
MGWTVLHHVDHEIIICLYLSPTKLFIDAQDLLPIPYVYEAELYSSYCSPSIHPTAYRP